MAEDHHIGPEFPTPEGQTMEIGLDPEKMAMGKEDFFTGQI